MVVCRWIVLFGLGRAGSIGRSIGPCVFSLCVFVCLRVGLVGQGNADVCVVRSRKRSKCGVLGARHLTNKHRAGKKGKKEDGKKASLGLLLIVQVTLRPFGS